MMLGFHSLDHLDLGQLSLTRLRSKNWKARFAEPFFCLLIYCQRLFETALFATIPTKLWVDPTR